MKEATVNGVTFSDEMTLMRLGLAVYSDVTANGVKVNALIDTGSPVTIMSLKKAMQKKERVQFPTRVERATVVMH